MMIYLALLIPLLTALFVAIKFRQDILAWEVLVILSIPVLCVFGVKLIAQNSLIYTDEYWNAYGTVTRYYEDWDEEVPCRHPKYRTETYTDSQGHLQTRTVFEGYKHLYDVDYHPARWELATTSGGTVDISEAQFDELCKRWNMRQFQDLNRHYHSHDGDMYFANWDNNFQTMEPVASTHRYKNKVKCSDSVFNFQLIDPKVTPVFNYHDLAGYRCDYIYGAGNAQEQLLLHRWNALIGAKKKVVMLVIPYFNKPVQKAFEQESYWKGGNKNEFILCVGVSSSTIAWTKVVSWTPQTTLKAQVEREVREMQAYNLTDIINYLGNTLEKSPGIIRRDFEEFDYITVPVPTWGIVLAYVLSVLSSVGLALWAVKNNFGHRKRRRYETWVHPY